jgi:GNAT superfamily N-acetyltransferase
MKIRKASLEDIEIIFSLWEELMIYHRSHHPIFRYRKKEKKALMNELKNRMEQPETCLFLAEEGTQAIGFIFACFRKMSDAFYHYKKGYIAETVVSEKVRGQGVGKSLYQEAENWLIDLGADHIELQVSSANSGALEFWKNRGFKPTTYHMVKIIDSKIRIDHN